MSNDRAAGPTVDLTADLDTILAARDVLPVFAPVVDLRTRETVAFQTLARGPADGPLERTDVLFDAARRTGRLAELDELCRARSLEAVLEAGLHAPQALFVRRESADLARDAPSASHLVALRRRGLRLVVELTERALVRDPAGLLAYADRLRTAGLALALDGVGADPRAAALMPFLRPDVVKLDPGMTGRAPGREAVRVLAAVTAHAEQTGALVLAQGVETAEDETRALALGAALAQGGRYGRPAPLSEDAAAASPRRPLVLGDGTEGTPPISPFTAVSRATTPPRAPRSLLAEFRRLVERQTADMHGLAVVLVSGVDAPPRSAEDTRQYTALVEAGALVLGLGTEMSGEVVPGMSGVRVDPDDPVAGEWDLVVVTPHLAVALVARHRREDGPGGESTFAYALSYDRATVLAAARSLLARVVPRRSAAGLRADLRDTARGR